VSFNSTTCTTDFSAFSYWDTGPSQPQDWHGAQWIGRNMTTPNNTCDFFAGAYSLSLSLSLFRFHTVRLVHFCVLRTSAVRPAPLLRHSFSIGQPARRAILYTTGLGYYELYLNSETVTDTVLNPGTASAVGVDSLS
jgi:hypothetical protein